MDDVVQNIYSTYREVTKKQTHDQTQSHVEGDLWWRLLVAATNDGKWQSLTDEGKDSREATTIHTDDEAKKNNNKIDKKE